MKRVARAALYLYKITLSPYFGSCCRFTPSCSEYALQAIEKYGLLKGCGKGIIRLIKCGPWHGGGRDMP